MSSGSTVKAGAAYEAVLVDKVTANVNTIVDSLGKLEQAFARVSPAAAAVASSMTQISTNMRTASKVATRTENAMSNFRRQMTSITTAISTAGQSIGQTLIHIGNQIRNLGLVATAFAGAVYGGFAKSVMVFSRYRGAVETINAVFGKSADSAREWAEAFSNRVGRSITETLEGLTVFRAAFSSLDLPEKELDSMSKKMQELAVDLAAFFNISDEEGIRAMMMGLSGSAVDELRKRGIFVEDKLVKEYAESLGMVSEELTTQEKMLLRYAMIVEQMEDRLGAAGQAMRERDSLPNQLKILRAEIEKLMLVIGQRFEPIAAKLVRIMQNVAKAIAAVPAEQFDRIATIAGVIGAAGIGLSVFGIALAALGPPLLGIASVLATIAAVVQLAVPLIIAMGPALAVAVGAVGVATLAIGGLLGLLTISRFPLAGALFALDLTLRGIFENAKKSIEGISAAVALQDWKSVWNIVILNAKIAFLDFAAWLAVVITLAITSAINAALDIIYSIPRRWSKANEDTTRSKRPWFFSFENRSKLQKELEALIAALVKARKELPTEKKPGTGAGKTNEEPDWYKKGYVQGDYEKYLPEAIQGNTWRSLGSTSAMFARATGLFGPSITPDRQQKKAAEIGEDQLKVQEKMLAMLRRIQPFVFE